MKVAYLFTYDYSLQTWNDSGILKRELEILEKLQNDNIKFTLITYGNKMDLEFTEVNEKFEIIPIYNHVKYFDSKI